MDEFGLEPDDPFEDAFESLEEPTRPPPSFHELDKLQYHIDLHDVGERLQNAANAAFPNDKRMRYSTVYVLMVCWEDEDPNLPVSIEVDELCDVFHKVYRFIVDVWKIPKEGSHKKLNQKVLDFVELGGDSKDDLKIVYYGGHGMLAHNRHSCWASRPNPKDPSYRMVKWSGIQHALEEAESDILLLFDCCASGTANTDVGHGVTELIAACGFNGSANPVGPDSFTNTLITELRLLSNMPSFTVGVLYNKILCRIQSKMPAGREMQKSPLHVVLSQDRRLPKGIQLSPHREIRNQAEKDTSSDPSASSDLSEDSLALSPSGLISPLNSSLPSRLSSSSPSDGRNSLDQHPSSSSISSLFSDIEQFPRIALTIRLKESLAASEVSVDLLADWLRMMPVLAENIKIEAGFASLSTLLIISVPVAIWCYIPNHPAMSVIGIVKSTNLLPRSPTSSTQASFNTEKSLAAIDPAKCSINLSSVIAQDRLNTEEPVRLRDGLHLPPSLASESFSSSKSPFRAPDLDVHPHSGSHKLSARSLTSSVPTSKDDASTQSKLGVSSVSIPSNGVPTTISEDSIASPTQPYHKPSKSSSKKKVYYSSSSNSRIESRGHRSSRDSGYDSSRRSSPARMSDLLEKEHDDKHYNLSAAHEALNAANGRIRQLEASFDQLNGLLAESNKENRRLKKERNDMSNKVDDLMRDLNGVLQRESSGSNTTERPSPRPTQRATALRWEANTQQREMPRAPPPLPNPFTPYSFMSPRPPSVVYASTTGSYTPSPVSYTTSPGFRALNSATSSEDPSPDEGRYPNDGKYHPQPF